MCVLFINYNLELCFIELYPNSKHSTKKPVSTMLTYPWKCSVLHCNHLGNIWKPLVLMTPHFDYCPSASEGDNQSVGSSAPVVSRCFPGGYNVKLYISRCRLAWWLLAFLHSARHTEQGDFPRHKIIKTGSKHTTKYKSQTTQLNTNHKLEALTSAKAIGSLILCTIVFLSVSEFK